MNGRLGLAQATADQNGFGNLREVAARLLDDTPDGLDDATVARALFGASDGHRWAPLLGGVLGGDPRFTRQDGRWCRTDGGGAIGSAATVARSTTSHHVVERPTPGLTDSHGTTLPFNSAASVRYDESLPRFDGLSAPAEQPILALALVTTGADPQRHRIKGIALVRREHGDVTARFDAEVGGEWRLARRRDSGVDAFTGAAALPFEEVLPSVLELIGREPVHVYGAKRVWAFLDAERRRAGLPEFELRLHELDERIRELLPKGRKPGLVTAAEELGLPDAARGTALSEADLVARVLERLRERAATSPARGALVAAPASDGTGNPYAPVSDANEPLFPPALPFTDAWLAGVLAGPGVYVVEDAAGAALYIGKAVALQKRLSAYVSKPLAQHRQFEALGVRAVNVRTVEAPSDLEATLLEGWLIRQLQPSFNTAREVRPPATIIRAAHDDSSPRIQLVGETRADGARYFGPFESTSAARHTADICRAVYPDAFARRRGDVAAQRRAVLSATLLLAGQRQTAIETLRQSMSDAAAHGDATEVSRLRAALRDVQEMTIRPSVLVGLAAGWRLLVLESLIELGVARLHLIQDGRLMASADTDRSALPTRPRDRVALADGMLADAEDSGSIAPDEDWSPADEATLMRWLVQARGRIEVTRVPMGIGQD